MAAAQSLTPAELQTVLAYTASQPYAQRNRAMLMMTVAAGLRVSEVAGLTLGDVLDSKGCVRGEVFLAAHRVKHQHARTIYINSRLLESLGPLRGCTQLEIFEIGYAFQITDLRPSMVARGSRGLSSSNHK